MTLLITVFAAVISTIVWFTSEKARKLGVGILLYMFWGASLMWLVDSAVEYIKEGADSFVPQPGEMLNDAFLGLSVTALAMTVWCVRMLIKNKDRIINEIIKKEQ